MCSSHVPSVRVRYLGKLTKLKLTSFIFGQVCPTSALITAAVPRSLREPPWPLSYYRVITTRDTSPWKAWLAQMWLGRAPDAKKNGEDTPHLQEPLRAEIPPTTVEFSPLYCCICPLSVHLSVSIPPRSPTLASKHGQAPGLWKLKMRLEGWGHRQQRMGTSWCFGRVVP